VEPEAIGLLAGAGHFRFHPIVLRKSPAPRPIAKNGQYLESEGPDFESKFPIRA
jgi:hypothetical protein